MKQSTLLSQWNTLLLSDTIACLLCVDLKRACKINSTHFYKKRRKGSKIY